MLAAFPGFGAIPMFSMAQHSTKWFLVGAIVSTLLFVGIMAVLHRLSSKVKKWTTVILTFVAGLYFLLEYLWPLSLNPGTGEMENPITPTVPNVSLFVTDVFLWTLFLGVISLTMVHGRKLLKRLPGWHHSLAFFLSMIAMLVFGFWSRLGTAEHASFIVNRTYLSLYSGLMINLDAAMFSLLAFYIASAAYRAFRIRTVEAALLMISALIIMLGFISFGVAITNWIPAQSGLAFFRIENLASWLLSWINMPAQRAIAIGVGVGALAMAMRLWLSLERGAFFSQE